MVQLLLLLLLFYYHSTYTLVKITFKTNKKSDKQNINTVHLIKMQ